MRLSDNAVSLLQRRYCSHGENVNDIFPRVAKSIAKHTPGANGTLPQYEKEYLEMLTNLDFLPNSPCIRNAGYNNMDKACFVLPVEDSISGIYRALWQSAVIFKQGGGVGYNFSDIREAGAPLHSGGEASGALSFMNLYDASTEAVKQGGFRRGACCPTDTYALTKKGWKLHHEISVGDEILTFNPEVNRTEFQPILKMNVFNYKGKLHHFKTKFLDFQCTPDHRVIYKGSTVQKFFSIAPARGLPESDLYIPTNSAWMTDRTDYPIDDDMIKLAAWIITEASVHVERKNHRVFDIWQSEKANPKYCQEIDEIFERYKWKHPIYKDSRHYKQNSTRVWHVFEYDIPNIDIESNHKIIPAWMLEKLSLRQLKILFDTIMKGDGHKQQSWGKFVSKGEKEADRFLMLCTLLGYRASKHPYTQTLDGKRFSGFYVSINFKRKYATLKPDNCHQTEYDGIVWCPTVENGFWVAMRNGKPCITGNSMGVIEYDHPEILDFIISKARYTKLENFNLSVLVTDDFMKRVDNDDDVHLKSRVDRRKTTRTVKARDIFWLAVTYAWANGCPGLLFFDRINKDNPLHPKQSIRATNPCGEVPLFPYESCCLGSMNLSNCITDNDIDFGKLDYLIEKGTYFLMGMNKATQYPDEISQCYEMQNRFFRLGLGVMGFGDMLMKMHVMYDSAETLKIIDKIGRHMQKAAKYAPLSVATLSIAPTGSLSIVGDCSSGIEPIFAPDYERRVVAGTFKESRNGEYLRTAHEITYDWHLKILARWQKWIDNGVSKTINLPYDASQTHVADAYKKAWKMGCKGVTIYRDGSKDHQVYYSRKCNGESCHL